MPQMLRSDLIFMTKTGLEQLEEVIECRTLNSFRNKKIPKEESFGYERFIGTHNPKSRLTPEWTNIIKPIVTSDEVPEQLDVLTPSLSKLHYDLRRKELEEVSK